MNEEVNVQSAIEGDNGPVQSGSRYSSKRLPFYIL